MYVYYWNEKTEIDTIENWKKNIFNFWKGKIFPLKRFILQDIINLDDVVMLHVKRSQNKVRFIIFLLGKFCSVILDVILQYRKRRKTTHISLRGNEASERKTLKV